ncbi:MAG: mechanosensitive ion channel domain-containing protein [Leadbetterella sp.]
MGNTYHVLFSALAILAAIIIRYVLKRIVEAHAKKYDLDLGRKKYALKFFNMLIALGLSAILGIIWDFSFKGLSRYILSAITVAGVALFATWSILSNITSSIVLFFNSPIRIGSTIEIIDKDNGVKGRVMDIGWFSIEILSDDGNLVSYPTNVAVQKPIKLYTLP